MARPRGEKLRCTKEPYIEDVGPQRIKSVRFDALSGEEIKKVAEVQVWTNAIYDRNERPVKNGLIDLRMGPANKKEKCDTCGGDNTVCHGHFGYLKLVLPVFNVGYINSIVNVLKCICKSCGRILLSDKDRKDMLKKMRNPKSDTLIRNELMKKVRIACNKPNVCCPHCGFRNGLTKKATAQVIIVEDFSKVPERVEEFRAALSHMNDKRSFQNNYYLTPVKVLALFKKMPDEDCELLNLHVRPEKLIVTDIAIPPATIRPSVFVDSGRSNEDALTTILKNIINTNSILQEELFGAAPCPAYKCLECWAHLQVQVTEFINSEAPSVRDSKNRGLVQRLKGKQGRFRCNLMGKRVEFTGRTVISPDPNLKISEVGIPVLMARVLTYPERVTRHNIEKLRQCVRNGPYKHPGANFVISPDGSSMHLKFAEKKNVANELKVDYIVERHLEDGDIVLFNRQPSLHRMSIMCHRARIMPWRTLRFNESVCNPYNADFDGDEMNMHAPQTEEARTEAFTLMGVQNNLCTPKNGEILVASTQDFLTSSFLITRKDTFYDRASFSLMCSYIGDGMNSVDLPSPTIVKPIELWTGKQLFSVLIRPNAQTRVFLNLIVKEKIYVGETKAGRNPETMCPCDGYVYFRNSELISGQLGKVTLGNGNKNGLFSVLLRDYNSDVAARCMNRLAKLSARWIGNHGFSIGIDDVKPSSSLKKQKKKTIGKGYEKCIEFIKRFEDRELPLKPGANAAETLEIEITDVLNDIRGQAGKDCMGNLHWRNSPLIMSQCGSKGSPINISQMIICVGQQSVGGRRAPNGFIDRTLPHFPVKSRTPAARGFVANSFYSGLTATEFFFHTMGGREGLVDTAVKTADTGYMSRRLMKGLEDLALYYDQTVRTASADIVQFIYGDDGMDPAKMEGQNSVPLNLDQLFMKVLGTCPFKPHKPLSGSEIIDLAKDRLAKYDMSPEGGCSSKFNQSLLQFLEGHAHMVNSTRSRLQLQESGEKNYSSVLEKLAANISGISNKQLEVFLETCISRYHKKKLEAGAAIGSVGAQSIGEPGTQMTLKTFHFAGVASMNVTLGVPRIKEIINAAKKIGTPIITVILCCPEKEESARMVKAEIEKTVLAEVAEAVKLVLKSSQVYISIVLDKERITALLHVENYLESIKNSILNHPKIKLKPEHITIRGKGNLRIFPPATNMFELHTLMSMLLKVIVKGIPTIERAVIKSDKVKTEEDKSDKAKSEDKVKNEEDKSDKAKNEEAKSDKGEEDKSDKAESEEAKSDKGEEDKSDKAESEEAKSEDKVKNEDDNSEEAKSGEAKSDKAKSDEKYSLLAEGTNLLAVMGTPGVDASKTRSNHIMEIKQTLGIEAARRSIIDEIQFTMSGYGMSIDIRHMMLLADLMTYKGEVLGMTRFGISKMKESVLMLASFEKTAEHLFNASFNARVDQIEGVSECIIMGVPMELGTGMLKVRQRVQELPVFKYGPDPILCEESKAHSKLLKC